MALTTINTAKESARGYQPLCLADIVCKDGAALHVSTHPVTYNSVVYAPRVMGQNLDPIQALSDQGVDVPPAVKLTLADADKTLYQFHRAHNIKGARITLTFVFYDVAAGTFSSDVVLPFVGRCDKPEVTDEALTVTASHILNLQAKLLPTRIIQERCPNIFPVTAGQKALAATKGTPFYPCGVTDATKTSCDYTKAGCAANNNSARFAGIAWQVPPGSHSREYVSGQWLDLKSDPCAAKYGDYAPIVYGSTWVDALVTNVFPEANSTRGEAILAEGPVEQILKLVIADEMIPAATNMDGGSYQVSEPLMRYNVLNRGDRDGAANADTPWNGGGDPYGSMCAVMWCVHRKVAESTPRVRALIRGPKIQCYAAIASISNGVVTFVGANTDCAGNPPFTVTISGNSGVNGTFQLTNWTYGPPGTITLSGNSGSGTGGYVAYETYTESYAWVIFDVLRRAGLELADVDLASFMTAATRFEGKYKCSLVIRQRRSAAEILTGLLRGCNSHLARNLSTGKIALVARGTIAEQQPAAMDGSNYGSTVAGGYAAYHFAESSMIREDGKSSLRIPGRPIASTPNSISFPFINSEREYVQDALRMPDSDDVNLIGQEINANFAVEGVNTLDHAKRIAATYLAEQLGGEQYEWASTFKGVRCRVGDIVLVSNTKHGLDHQPMRLQRIAPSANWETARFTATLHKDTWYNPTFTGESPVAESRRNRLARPAWVWQPNIAQPDGADPLYGDTEKTFGLQLLYETAKDGTPIPRLQVRGVMPVNEPAALMAPVLAPQGTTANTGGSLAGNGTVYFIAVAAMGSDGMPGAVSSPCQIVVAQAGSTNTITASVTWWDPAGTGYQIFAGRNPNRLAYQGSGSGQPSTVTVTDLLEASYGAPDTEFDRLLVRIKRVVHGGVFGAAVNAVGAGTMTITGAGWSANQWNGYDCCVLSKTDGSTLPVLNFSVSSNTATVLTVTPDPQALGVAVGDVLVMYSKPTVSGLTLTDARWCNSLSNNGAGLATNEEKGRVLRIIAGKGRGFSYSITGNSDTAITVNGPWVITPDSTSRYIVEESGWLPDQADSNPLANSDPSAVAALSIPVDNYAGAVLLAEAVALDGGGNESLSSLNPLRMIYVPGQGFSPKRKTVKVSSNTTLTAEAQVVEADATAASFTITAPSALDILGIGISIVKVDSTAHTVTVAAHAGETIGATGATSVALSNQGDTVNFEGTNA